MDLPIRTASLFVPELNVEQSYKRVGASIRESLKVGRHNFRSVISPAPASPVDATRGWQQAYLQGASIAHPTPTRCVNVVDLFCGAGGLALGVRQAARSLATDFHLRLAVDADSDALSIYQGNLGVDAALTRDIQSLVDYKVLGSGPQASFAYRPSIVEPLVGDLAHFADLVIAGPPCQGHSNLNNRTRRSDERNLLYLTATAFAVASSSKALIFENVPDVIRDRHNVVSTARALLAKEGYSISEAVLTASRFGVAQTRRRHFLVAIKDPAIEFSLVDLTSALEIPALTVGNAIRDLLGKEGSSEFDAAAILSAENKVRVDWLFDQGEHDLPDHIRPLCHQNGHTYKNVYGRLAWDEPAGTITTGFLTPGRGRYFHPKERRGLTPHEGARLQGFPDSFSFVTGAQKARKATFAKVIGDAVPPALGRAVGIATLSLLLLRN